MEERMKKMAPAA